MYNREPVLPMYSKNRIKQVANSETKNIFFQLPPVLEWCTKIQIQNI